MSLDYCKHSRQAASILKPGKCQPHHDGSLNPLQCEEHSHLTPHSSRTPPHLLRGLVAHLARLLHRPLEVGQLAGQRVDVLVQLLLVGGGRRHGASACC